MTGRIMLLSTALLTLSIAADPSSAVPASAQHVARPQFQLQTGTQFTVNWEGKDLKFVYEGKDQYGHRLAAADRTYWLDDLGSFVRYRDQNVVIAYSSIEGDGLTAGDPGTSWHLHYVRDVNGERATREGACSATLPNNGFYRVSCIEEYAENSFKRDYVISMETGLYVDYTWGDPKKSSSNLKIVEAPFRLP